MYSFAREPRWVVLDPRNVTLNRLADLYLKGGHNGDTICLILHETSFTDFGLAGHTVVVNGVSYDFREFHALDLSMRSTSTDSYQTCYREYF